MHETNLMQNIEIKYEWPICCAYDEIKSDRGDIVLNTCNKPAVVQLQGKLTYQVDDKGTTRTMDRFLCLKHWQQKHSEKKK